MVTKEKKYQKTNYQFIFKIDNDIICQRFFHINGYNKQVRNSYELKKTMDDICNLEYGLIPQFLISKSVDYMWNTYNPYYTKHNYKYVLTDNIYNNESIFKFEFLIEDEVVSQSCFTANIFPHEVRNNIDIRRLYHDIIKKLAVVSSKKHYTNIKEVY